MEQIKQSLQDIIKQLYDVEVRPVITLSDGERGDFSTNIAFQLSKSAGKKPLDIATEIANQFAVDGIAATPAAPGFINFTVAGKLAKQWLDADWSDRYGESDAGAGKKALVEYPSPNLAKPFSVGHLRPSNQGWAVRNLLLATGWEVVTDNHLGDSGTPFGYWVLGFQRHSSDEKLAADGIYELGRVYIEIRRELKEEAAEGKTELADAAQNWLKKLEAKDPEAVAYSARFNKISLDHMHKVMTRMSISTDLELGESFFVEPGKQWVEHYLKEGVFTQNDDGSVICRLDDQGIEVPMLMLKSNGAALYATTDLGCLKYRESEIKPDYVVMAIAAEQKFYLEQLFAVAKKIGIPQDYVHMWFGLIDQISEDGKREKMSSRKGVVFLEELLDKAEVRTRELIAGRDDVSDTDVATIAIGAIKFTDFLADRRTGILFDWDKIFSLTGFSGPFIQYAAVRANKIIAEGSSHEANNYDEYDFEAEKSLIKLLLDYPNVITTATDLLEAHRVAAYVFRLAQEFNRYYENTPVLKSEPSIRTARLDVLRQFVQVVTHALNILGIGVPSKM
jgi:arginyl-tRNA synthetase